ncbi:MAG TPA: hypothetical protein VFZ41_06965 [Solirubrobacterales bacterium]
MSYGSLNGNGNRSHEPHLAASAISVRQWLTEVVQETSQRRHVVHSPGDRAEQAAVGAAVSIVGACLTDEEIGPLPDLTATLVPIILTPYLGRQWGNRVRWAA